LFVNRDFYVDDALTSLPTISEAVSLMKRTQRALEKSNLVLHKVASNKEEVILAFPSDQLANSLKAGVSNSIAQRAKTQITRKVAGPNRINIQ